MSTDDEPRDAIATTRNEAANRVRAFIDKTPSYSDVIWQHEGREYFEEALKTERRITVERIRDRLEAMAAADRANPPVNAYVDECVYGLMPAILDEEAAL